MYEPEITETLSNVRIEVTETLSMYETEVTASRAKLDLSDEYDKMG